MAWWDFFKLFDLAFKDDPLSRVREKRFIGGGHTQPDAIPDIRGPMANAMGGAGVAPIRDTNEFIDLSSVTNRQSRYKEYERLRAVAEIESVLTILADETCLAGNTIVPTPSWGLVNIKWLAENKSDKRFLVYSWDFKNKDFTLGWAFDPRLVKEAETVKIYLDNGKTFICTYDHKILTRDARWKMAGDLEFGDELMPFYHLPANQFLTKIKNNQFPRIYTFSKGWIHERQFIDEWKSGSEIENYKLINKASRLLAQGATIVETEKMLNITKIEHQLEKIGFSPREVKWLGTLGDKRRIVGIEPGEKIPVYDMSVEEHENFCTDWGVAHNCQKGENDQCFEIKISNDEIKDELKWLFFHRKMLNFDQKRLWNIAKQLYLNGDHFNEIIMNPDNPKDGIQNLVPLPPDSMYRIETTKGRLIEFQQSKEGPDYQSLARVDVSKATESELQQGTAIRFAPYQVVHFKIGDDRKTFYPYGVSLVEAARGPAHQLRLMEDAMVVYRLCLIGDTRVRTKESWKYIKDVKIGDDVFSYTPEGQIIPTKVTWHVNNGVQKVYRVKSDHIEITGTATHPVLVNRDGIIQYVDIKDIQPKRDQFIITTRKAVNEKTIIPKFFGEKWAKLSLSQQLSFKKLPFNKSQLMRECSEIVNLAPNRIKQFLYSKGKALPLEKAKVICDKFNLDSDDLTVINKGEINSDRINVPEYVTEEFAELFGFLIGDGSIKKENNYCLCFAAGEYPELNEKYAKLMETYFGRVHFEKDKRSKKNLGNYCVSSVTACKILRNLGYISGDKNKRIPNWVFTSSLKIRKAFIKGLADADAHVRNLQSGLWTAEFEMCNKQLIEDIKELWNSIGLCTGLIRYRKREGGHEIVAGRKMKETESWAVYISERELPEYEKIQHIEYAGEEEVYDITVDNDLHNFIANCTPVHNTRAPERRVFYIDVGQLAPYRAEAFIERLKDQFRKKKVSRGGTGASAVEERWHAPAADEDYWVPIRPNTNTRIETLPGAANLGEIDDAVYFRNKLYTALNFPKNYFNQDDPGVTRITLSAQDVKFARMIERLQSYIEDGLWAIADRHLKLRGFPEDTYEDLEIKMTPPSDWRELSRAEVVNNRISVASQLKGSQLYGDYDILVDILKITPDEAKEKLARLKIQKLEELKMQIIAQNPTLLGVGLPGPAEPEVGTGPEGPSPMLGGEEPPPEAGGGEMPPEAGSPIPSGGPAAPSPTGGARQGPPIEEPADDDIKKYNLDIVDYSKEKDEEEIDFSEI